MNRKKKKQPADQPLAKPDSNLTTNATLPSQRDANQGSDVGSTWQTNTAEPVSMAKLVSFALLLAVIVLLGIVFYKVMASFLVPMFLAALLVVIFEPFHQWFLEKFKGREVVAAGLTTLCVMLTVLVPISILLVMAVAEGQVLFRQARSPKIVQSLKELRHNLKLDMPSATQFLEIESRFKSLLEQIDADEMDKQRLGLSEINQNASELAAANDLPWPNNQPADTASEIADDVEAMWREFILHLAQARKIESAAVWHLPNKSLADKRSFENRPPIETETEEPADQPNELLEQEHQRHLDLREYENHLQLAQEQFESFKVKFLGGPTRALFTQAVNPTDDEIESYADTMLGVVKNRLPQLGSATTAFLGSLLLGTAIMVFSLYFFLLDGERMIASIKGLSPLDDEHETELIQEFGRVSRAVVVATLLSAMAQGILAGIGFYFAGLESIFLLTLLSAVLAMVPFVGAASVWIPCSLYLYFSNNDLAGAIGLAVYGVAVISMADNIIKPMVLHGQSNIHPLLALLSVIGGVATLGPIGILVGPMVVVFLQTLLKILRRELDSISTADNLQNEPPNPKPPEEAVPA